MRILPVNLINNPKNTVSKNTNPFFHKDVSFGGFIDIFKKSTPPSLLNEEQQKNKEIFSLVEDLSKENRKIFSFAKRYKRDLKGYMWLGKISNYEGYVSLSEKNKEYLIFGDFDEETKLPQKVQKISMKEGFKPIVTYNIVSSKFGYYTIEDYTVDDVFITMQAKGDRILHIQETEKFTRNSKELVPVGKKEFLYQEGKRKDDDSLEVNMELYIDGNNDEKCYYKELVDGEWITYVFNGKSDMWEKVPQ